MNDSQQKTAIWAALKVREFIELVMRRIEAEHMRRAMEIRGVRGER